MGNHFIPKYYLKGFANDDERDYIHCYVRLENRHFRSNLVKIAQENNLYSDTTEDILTRTIEQPCIPIFEKICAKEPLEPIERLFLTDYIIIMKFRTPAQRDSTLERIDEESEPYTENLKNWLHTIAISKTPLSEKANCFLEQIGRKKLQDIVDPKQVWEFTLNPEKYPQTRKAIFSMYWHFFVHRDRVFLTCDNPFFYFKEIGLAHNQTEITFPISSNIALLATWQQRGHSLYSNPTDSTIRQINKRTVANASKFIFSHDYVDWKLKLANKPCIEFQKLL
jgi:hypothetical protein